MNDDIHNLVIPILRSIQADIAGVKEDVSSLKSDISFLKIEATFLRSEVSSLKNDVSILKDSVRRIDAKMGAMSSYMAGFYSSLNWLENEFSDLKGRVEFLEEKNDRPPI